MVPDPDPYGRIRIRFDQLDPDPLREYGSVSHKSEENASFEVLDVLFLRNEDISCSKDVLYSSVVEP